MMGSLYLVMMTYGDAELIFTGWKNTCEGWERRRRIQKNEGKWGKLYFFVIQFNGKGESWCNFSLCVQSGCLKENYHVKLLAPLTRLFLFVLLWHLQFLIPLGRSYLFFSPFIFSSFFFFLFFHVLFVGLCSPRYHFKVLPSKCSLSVYSDLVKKHLRM